MWKYFKEAEFACPGCGENEISTKLIDMLEVARATSLIPFHINSGYRCRKHNKKVGGNRLSAHKKGLAADIRAKTSKDRYRIINGLIDAGFTRIGIAKTFIHVDIDSSKPQCIIYLY